MVKGFKVTCEDRFTIGQIKAALTRLPKDLTFTILKLDPLEVDITPITDKVKLAMYKDDLKGKEGKATEKLYLNIITPFFRQYVRHIKKMEIKVYG